MRVTPALEEAKRQLEICNACRYCEGFCAVFPALERRRDVTPGDVGFLSNLCHSCKGCFYACQYAPPHELAVNIPKILATVRAESYVHYSWPGPLARLFERNGMVVSLVTAGALSLVLVLAVLLQDSSRLFGEHSGPGAFYQVVPKAVMTWTAGIVFLYALLALFMGGLRFWRDARPSAGANDLPKAVGGAASDILLLTNLGGGGHGCNDKDEGFSGIRRWLHHAMFYGFALCFASTTSGWVYDTFFGLEAPYPFFSLPVIFGTVGGLALLVGTVGLLVVKAVSDRAPNDTRLWGADAALLMLLALTSLTGLLLLAFRSTSAMGILLAVHLGIVLALFLVLPYSKFVHGIYRSCAILKDRLERNGASVRPRA